MIEAVTSIVSLRCSSRFSHSTTASAISREHTTSCTMTSRTLASRVDSLESP